MVTTVANPTVSAPNGSICVGQSFTLVPSGASTYTISGGSSVVSPITTTNYSITGTSAQGCVSSNTAISTVTVNALPIITAFSQTICSGSTTTLVASGASSYTWSTGATTNSIVVTPTANTVYTVNGTNASGCLGSVINVTVTLGSAPSIAVNSSTICAGANATLIASGVSTYTWGNGANTSSIIVSPSATTIYTVNGSQVGCSTNAVNISTVTVPAVTITGNTSICNGQSTTLTALGGNSYSWSTGATNASIPVSPTANTTYTVTGTNTVTGCNNVVVQTITVNALPTISITGTLSVCNGNAASLSANGATSYTWNTGANSANITVSPSANTTYTVIGRDINTCSNSAVATVSVGSLPIVSAASGSICQGQTFSITPTGANSYTLSSGSANVSPSVTTVYTITGSNTQGCVNTATVSVTVNTTPTLNAGNPITINTNDNFALNGSTNATSYTWSPASNLNNPNSLTPSGTGLQTTIFTLTVTAVNGCTNSQVC